MLGRGTAAIGAKVLGAAAGLTDSRWGGPVVDGVSLTDTPLALIHAKVRKTPSWPRRWANSSLL
jgi:hypothetical protein